MDEFTKEFTTFTFISNILSTGLDGAIDTDGIEIWQMFLFVSIFYERTDSNFLKTWNFSFGYDILMDFVWEYCEATLHQNGFFFSVVNVHFCSISIEWSNW